MSSEDKAVNYSPFEKRTRAASSKVEKVGGGDQRAKHVLDACRLAGLNVPSQIQMLGVDNETYVCEQTIPSFSSLMPDFENGGFLTDVHGTTRRVAAAHEFIRQHATSGIGV